MNQDQYHASLLNKNQPIGLGWDGITKASTPKVYPPEKPNQTDVEDTIKRVKDNDHKLTDLNWNNIKVSLTFFRFLPREMLNYIDFMESKFSSQQVVHLQKKLCNN